MIIFVKGFTQTPTTVLSVARVLSVNLIGLSQMIEQSKIRLNLSIFSVSERF